MTSTQNQPQALSLNNSTQSDRLNELKENKELDEVEYYLNHEANIGETYTLSQVPTGMYFVHAINEPEMDTFMALFSDVKLGRIYEVNLRTINRFNRLKSFFTKDKNGIPRFTHTEFCIQVIKKHFADKSTSKVIQYNDFKVFCSPDCEQFERQILKLVESPANFNSIERIKEVNFSLSYLDSFEFTCLKALTNGLTLATPEEIKNKIPKSIKAKHQLCLDGKESN